MITLSLLFVYILYLYKKMHYTFDKNGIKYLKGLPLFGNTFNSTLLLKHTVQDMDVVYKAFPEERYEFIIFYSTLKYFLYFYNLFSRYNSVICELVRVTRNPHSNDPTKTTRFTFLPETRDC